jgi:hypothetical protein
LTDARLVSRATWQAAYHIVATQRAINKLEKCRDEIEVVRNCISDMVNDYETQEILMSVNMEIKRANLYTQDENAAQDEENSLLHITEEIQRANTVITNTEETISSIQKQCTQKDANNTDHNETLTQKMVQDVISQYTDDKARRDVRDGDDLNTRIIALKHTMTQKEMNVSTHNL